MLAHRSKARSKREIAEVIGRKLGLPARSIPAAQAADHFTGFPFITMDILMPNESTRELLGRQPTHPGLFADLAEGHYFDNGWPAPRRRPAVPPACGAIPGAATLDVVRVVSEVPVIAVRVLGPVEVIVSGVPVTAGGPRQRCVLARLIAAHGQVVPAERLIADLYAGDAPPRAHAAVQSYVSRLRRVLEPGRASWARAEVLVASPPGYALRLGDDAVDAWSF